MPMLMETQENTYSIAEVRKWREVGPKSRREESDEGKVVSKITNRTWMQMIVKHEEDNSMSENEKNIPSLFTSTNR